MLLKSETGGLKEVEVMEYDYNWLGPVEPAAEEKIKKDIEGHLKEHCQRECDCGRCEVSVRLDERDAEYVAVIRCDCGKTVVPKKRGKLPK